VNQGQLLAAATTTRYYFSIDTVKDAADYRIGATRAVPPLAPGGASSGTVSAVAPSVAPEGSTRPACATIRPRCRKGTRATTAVPPRVRCECSFPTPTGPHAPDGIQPGVAFLVTETVLNQGSGVARNSTTRPHLPDLVIDSPTFR
jgi:hypothetical protein